MCVFVCECVCVFIQVWNNSVDTYLVSQLIQWFDEESDEEVGGEEAADDDETDEVDVLVHIRLVHRLRLDLKNTHTTM